MVAMGFLGVSSASAVNTALCSVDPGSNPCSARNQISSAHLVASKALNLNNIQNVSCDILFQEM
jgi:hypothetical protein